MKKKEPTYKENKFRAFIKRSSEPLLGMQNTHHQHQVQLETYKTVKDEDEI